MWYSNPEKTSISRHILHQHWYIGPIALPVRQTRSTEVFDCCRSHFRISVSTYSSLDKCLPSTCEPLYATNTSHRRQEKFFCEYPWHWLLLPTKKHTHSSTLLFLTKLLKHGRHFDYWNQPLNMRMRICYLDCREAGLWRYIVMHIGNLLRPLQLFYFHLWHIYWFSLIRINHNVKSFSLLNYIFALLNVELNDRQLMKHTYLKKLTLLFHRSKIKQAIRIVYFTLSYSITSARAMPLHSKKSTGATQDRPGKTTGLLIM
jgi:hypothetical protein